MRKIHLYLTILIALSIVTLFVACEKDEDIDLTMISVASEQATPSYTSAKIECRFATKATLRNVYVQYATSQDFAEYEEREMANVDGIYVVTLDKLLDNTVYYVRYAVSNRYSSAMVEEISTFKTLIPSVPSIVLDSITSVWDTYANVKIRLAFDGGAPIQEMGICWGTQAVPVVENNKLTTKDTLAVLAIKDLQPNTKYHVRAYAVNKVGIAYSEEYELTTCALPEVKTEEVTDIQPTSALVSGTLVFNGNDTATVTGFCWETNEEPTLENEHAEVLTASASYTYHLSNLKNETKYYVRAYAQNRIGVVYGEVKSFTTLSAVIPTVTTSTVSQITETIAVAGGNVTSDGGASVTERGVVYSTSSNPTMANSKVASGSGTGAFTCNLTGLQPNTTYYVRAYAVNSKGTSYGDEVNFTTNEIAIFSVSATKKVTFSKGNLQYTQSTNTWSFAENQWDMIGVDNVTGGSITSTYGDSKSGTGLADKVDLFGWSTRATNFGVSTSTSNSDYSGSFVDWGTNQIGADAPNTWRTLTKDEWNYLFNTRTNASSLKGVAQVNGVNGLILLPDNWVCPAGVTFKSGFHSSEGVDYYAAYQTFTAEQWTKLEAAGAVFLPAAGSRHGSYVYYVQYNGGYWSATEDFSSDVNCSGFYSDGAYSSYTYRYNGLSVRLVKDL